MKSQYQDVLASCQFQDHLVVGDMIRCGSVRNAYQYYFPLKIKAKHPPTSNKQTELCTWTKKGGRIHPVTSDLN